MDAMQVLMSLRTNNHSDRQLTVNDLIEREPFSRYKFGRNTINKKKKSKIKTSKEMTQVCPMAT